MTAAPVYPLEGARVFVAGHRGMVGSALIRRLGREPCTVLTAPRAEVDLRRQADTEAWFTAHRPDTVILAAARVGGIAANRARPGAFIHDNLAIQTTVLDAARRHGVKRLIVLGSSCMYPREAPQPLAEDALLTGAPEPTNDAYAVAKLAGMKMADAYRREHGCDFFTVVPTNLYGPADTFHDTHGHVIPALMRRMHAAKVRGAASVTVWGSGRPRREFLHVDDCADAIVHCVQHAGGAEPVNIGTGRDLTIAELARTIAEVVGYTGELAFDTAMPDGMPRKRLDVSRLAALGWGPSIDLPTGLADTYRWFLVHGIAKDG